MEILSKIIAKLLIWCLRKCKKSEMLSGVWPLFNDEYRDLRCEYLPLRRELVKTKKGKIKYDLLFFEDELGFIRCNVGRHGDPRVFDNIVKQQ